MGEYGRVSEGRAGDAPEKIDITGLLQNFYQAVLKLWWLVIALTVIFALQAYFSVSTSYVPSYVASATVAVSSGTGASAEAVSLYDVQWRIGKSDCRRSWNRRSSGKRESCGRIWNRIFDDYGILW